MVLKDFINKINNNEDITIQFVGDSITHGLDHCRPEETYVAKFATFLGEKYKTHTVNRYDGISAGEYANLQSFDGPILVSLGECEGKIDVVRNGVGGNTVVRAHNRIDDFTGTLANGKSPDITFMMFGINDSITVVEEKYATPEQFKINYKNLIDDVKKRNPDTCIILMGATFNDFSVTEHCEKTRELAKEEGLPFIDMHSLWMAHYVEGAVNFGQGDWLFGGTDACHFTPLSAEISAKYIFDAFVKIVDADK